MNRRQFLAASVASVAALSAGTTGLHAADLLPSPQRRIRIGFLGASYSHAEGKLKVIQTSPDYELVGACEELPDARRRCGELGIRLLAKDELLNRCEAIAVESSVREHARDALTALQAGKHVHLEKPPSTSLKDMQKLVRVARDHKRLLQTGYMWRYHPGFKIVFGAVRKGWLGEVFMVRASIPKHLSPARRLEWTEFGGGSMFELGSHLVDAVVRLLGRPKRIVPFVRHHGPYADHLKDNNVAVFEFAKALAILTCNAIQKTDAPHRTFEVVGSGGSAILNPLEPPVLRMELIEPAGPYEKGLQTVSLPAYKRYEADFAELAAAVRGQQPLSVSLDEELLVQEYLLRACDML